jgi:hypothetical protein
MGCTAAPTIPCHVRWTREDGICSVSRRVTFSRLRGRDSQQLKDRARHAGICGSGTS